MKEYKILRAADDTFMGDTINDYASEGWYVISSGLEVVGVAGTLWFAVMERTKE